MPATERSLGGRMLEEPMSTGDSKQNLHIPIQNTRAHTPTQRKDLRGYINLLEKEWQEASLKL